MDKIIKLVNCSLILAPIVLIEGRQFDSTSGYVIFWSLVHLYFMMDFHEDQGFGNIPVVYSHIIAASVQSAYLFTAVDVRFLHISDDIRITFRQDAAVIYSLVIIMELGCMSFLEAVKYGSSIFIKPDNVRSILSLIYSINSIILVCGQIALNSRVSVILALPGALVFLLLSVELKKPGTAPS